MCSRLIALVRLSPLLAIVAAAVAVLVLAASASAQAGTLALAYLNTEKQGTSEIWVAAADGSNPHMLGTLSQSVRPLDLRGSLLAVASEPEIVIYNLAGGEPKRITMPRVTSGYVTEQGSVFYATRAGCGPAETKAKIGRIDAATGASVDVAEIEEPGAEVVWYDPTTDAFMLTPRGCDPGIWALRVQDGKTGAVKSSMEVRGCGWVTVAPNGKQALITDSCGAAGAPAFSVYDLQTKAQREVRLTDTALSSHPLVYAPDGSRAAFGTAAEGMNSPAFQANPAVKAKSSGIWLLDSASLAQTKLWQDEGLESWAIDWSPDGSKLLVASTEGPGRCQYFTVDIASGEATPIEGITICGATGTMLGFATLP